MDKFLDGPPCTFNNFACDLRGWRGDELSVLDQKECVFDGQNLKEGVQVDQWIEAGFVTGQPEMA